MLFNCVHKKKVIKQISQTFVHPQDNKIWVTFLKNCYAEYITKFNFQNSDMFVLNINDTETDYFLKCSCWK